jgi:flagellar protein FliL
MAEKQKGEKKAEKKAEAEGEVEAAEPKRAPARGRKKMILIVAAACALLLAIGTPLYFFASRGVAKSEPQSVSISGGAEERLVPEGYQEEDELDEQEDPLGAIFPLETFIVNLSGGKSFLRCQVQVEFTQRDVPKRFYVRVVPIRDAAIKILSSRTPEEISSAEGKEALKETLKEMINTSLKKEEVKAIYFTQFVVQ